VTERVYTITLDKAAQKALTRLPKMVIARIREKIDALGEEPRPPGCEKMQDTDNDYRVRVGDYRIIYSIYDTRLLILVIDIGPRKDIYRRRRK
jgi:mRNA interferase RelE/StbE